VQKVFFLYVPNGGYNYLMTEGDAFLRAIAEDPDDDTSRLAYADWLDEHGDHDRAEFIRLQCELARLPADVDGHRLEFRANELLGRHEWHWVGDLRDLVLWHRFGRGFVEDIGVDAEVFLNCPDNIFRQAPVQKAFIRTTLAQLPAVTASPDLPRLRVLRLGAGLGDEGAEIIARSPLLTRVQELGLGLNRIGPRGVESLARSSCLSQVRILDLSGNELGDSGFADVGSFSNLRSLDFSSNRIGYGGVAALARSPAIIGLETLLLRGNMPGVSRALAESTLLREHGILSNLDLTACGLGDAEVIDLASARWAQRLRKLHLGYNNIGQEGVEALVSSPLLTGLDKLDLSGNSLSPEAHFELRGRFGLKVVL
jgi:uncharacterized protein (TIGR02996 family)